LNIGIKCIKCFEDNQYFNIDEDQCEYCPKNTVVLLKENRCSCESPFVVEGEKCTCPKETPFLSEGKCISCYLPRFFNYANNQCMSCPLGKKFSTDVKNCVAVDCPLEQIYDSL
jgi:hypothetical protein